MSLYDLAVRVAVAGDEIAGAGVRLEAADPGPQAFGVDAPGRLGELGRALHRHGAEALAARSREAAAHSARLGEVADRLRRTAAGYADTDHESHRGIERESS